jgi:dihydropyrimidine dehydrogenase (NAD+) subunit PreT
MAIENKRLTPEQYEINFSDIHPPFETHDAALAEANRCIFCYDAPCTKLCPTSINVPKFISQIASENEKGAALTILSANIMGAGCSKVCPVEKLCEGACVYNLMEEKPIAIAKLQRYATERAITEKWPLFYRKPSVGKKVAIVGAGPAGLACAHALSREGVDVTIFEKENKGGGLMTYGIAAYKVTPQFCEDEVEFITSVGGIEISYGKELGKDIFLSQLQPEYDAIYLSIGVGLAKPLNIAGEELDGVIDALDFIYNLRDTSYSQVKVGDKVAVIGMGMTAIDAATQARRLGAAEVTIVYRRTQNEMPCTQAELDIAKMDGCNIVWLAAPLEIIGINGSVNRLVCAVMTPGEPDASGRRAPVETGKTIVLEVDMVIKATGQMPFKNLVNGLEISNSHGKITTNIHGSTNIQGLFAGGDCVNGGKEVVDAVQAGKQAAEGIIKWLMIND